MRGCKQPHALAPVERRPNSAGRLQFDLLCGTKVNVSEGSAEAASGVL